MVTDRQMKRLRRALISGKTLAQSADKVNMDEKTARKYRRLWATSRRGRCRNAFGGHALRQVRRGLA